MVDVYEKNIMLNKLKNDLASVDANYLLGKMNRNDYLKKRRRLKIKFRKLAYG